ncbi:MAG: sigma-70 family RNA polymerase sigma factor [Mycobacterium sp.]|uniref:sigma-70 family RNA polymerase sigma factor n=1 Tax=Mycobacterium sp. TaxID=1785 RepID=UPI003F9E79C8
MPLRENLYRRAMHLSHHHADAEDLVQETLLRAYAGFSSFELGTNVTAWLFRILTNAYIDGYRKKRRYPVQYSTDQITDLQLAAAYARSTPRGSRSAEDIALDSLPDDDTTAAMQALPRQYRTVVYYSDVEGLSYSEIAAITDTPHGTVMSRLHRGRRQLRRLLCNGANHPDSAEAMPG